MHPNPIFRKTGEAEALELARARAFGQLSVNGDKGPLAAYLPFLLSRDASIAEFHLMRSNPVARAPGPALLAVSGPDGYISPDWYGLEDQVPTWNYVAVHLRGRLEILPDRHLQDLLARLSEAFEARLAPKPAWRLDKLTPGTYARLARMIVPARLHVEEVQSTLKLGQNKPEEARLAAARAVAGGFGQELAALGELMRKA